jgi:hypothetical protein
MIRVAIHTLTLNVYHGKFVNPCWHVVLIWMLVPHISTVADWTTHFQLAMNLLTDLFPVCHCLIIFQTWSSIFRSSALTWIQWLHVFHGKL